MLWGQVALVLLAAVSVLALAAANLYSRGNELDKV